MTILLVEGFDYYSAISDVNGAMFNGGWVGSDVLTSTSLASGRFGGFAFSYGATSLTVRYYYRPVPSGSTFTVGFAFRYGTLDTGQQAILSFRNASGIQVAVGFNSLAAKQISATRASLTANVLGTSVAALAPSTWYYLTVEVLIHPSAGYVKVYLDGGTTPILNVTGVNTRGQSTDAVDRIALERPSAASLAFLYDDLYISDGADALTIGEVRVSTIYPEADTVDADFTPSTGTDHFALVDEAQANGDTDYVASSTVGHRDLYAFGALPVTPQNIFAVQAVAQGLKSGVDTREIKAALNSSGSEVQGTTLTLNASNYQPARVLAEVDPNTAAAWTAPAVAALVAGAELVT